MLKDETEAEEMVQRVFVTLWNKCERLTIESSLKAYLYRAVRNECLNYLKHQKVRAAYRVYYRARPEGGEERADDRLVAGELRVRLREAMDQLPPQCRDRKSTRLNSSHVKISYAVFCLKKKKKD